MNVRRATEFPAGLFFGMSEEKYDFRVLFHVLQWGSAASVSVDERTVIYFQYGTYVATVGCAIGGRCGYNARIPALSCVVYQFNHLFCKFYQNLSP